MADKLPGKTNFTTANLGYNVGMNPEIEKSLRNAFADYEINMTPYKVAEGSLSVQEYKLEGPNDPEEFKGKDLQLCTVIFDHESKPLSLAISWSSIKDTNTVFVGEMTFLTREVEVSSNDPSEDKKGFIQGAIDKLTAAQSPM
jgi:hypothetical protein